MYGVMIMVAAMTSVLAVSPAVSAEWWQDSFVWEESTLPCGDNDSIATYGDKTVEMWEASCQIVKKTAIRGLDGIILDLDCVGIEGDRPWTTREMLLKLPDGNAASFPPLKTLKRCSSIKEMPATAPQCDFNSRIYRSPTNADEQAYQELQFTEGLSMGTVVLTEYLNGNPIWTAEGKNTCSNGASICRIEFPLMLGNVVQLPYEIVDDELLVIPSLRQDVYQGERYAVMNGKNYGGVVADLLNGFAPKDNELTLPHNVYRYSECRVKPH